MLPLLHILGSPSKHPSSPRAFVPTIIIKNPAGIKRVPSAPAQAVRLWLIESKTRLLQRKQDQDSNGKPCPNQQKMALERRNLKRLTLTRAGVRAPRPFPFVPFQLLPPFVPILLILIPTPPLDDGSLITADVNIFIPSRSLRFIFLPEKGRDRK